jgi:hypothetical protein
MEGNKETMQACSSFLFAFVAEKDLGQEEENSVLGPTGCIVTGRSWHSLFTFFFAFTGLNVTRQAMYV